jgi:hypothetical protein
MTVSQHKFIAEDKMETASLFIHKDYSNVYHDVRKRCMLYVQRVRAIKGKSPNW